MTADTEASELQAKFRDFLSHATGGRTCDTTLPLNTMSVMATQKVNDVWGAALEKGRNEAADRITQLEQVAREAREALEPFADALGDDDDDEPDHTAGTLAIGRTVDYSLDLGDFRSARARLARIDALLQQGKRG